MRESERAPDDMGKANARIAELEAEVARLRGALEEVLAESEPIGTDYGHSAIVRICRAALAGDAGEEG